MAKSSISPADVHQKVGHSAFLDLVQTKLLHKALDQIKNLLCQIINVIEGPSASSVRPKWWRSETYFYLWTWRLHWVLQESEHQTCVGRESVSQGCEAQVALIVAFSSSVLLSRVSHQSLNNTPYIPYWSQLRLVGQSSTAIPWTIKAFACSFDTVCRCKVLLYKEITHSLAHTDQLWGIGHEQELSWHSCPGKTKPGMSQERGQKESCTWSSRLGVECGAKTSPRKYTPC